MNTRHALSLSVAVLIALLVLYVASTTRPPHAGEKSKRALCANNLRQIGFALLEYRKANGHFPPQVVRHKPSGCLHSWRIELLPYLSMSSLYRSYKFDEPWDSKSNANVAVECPPAYVCPSDDRTNPGCTSYVMIVRNSGTGTGVCGIGEGDSIIVVEVKGANIQWAEPRDIRLGELSYKLNDGSHLSISSDHPGGAHILYCDGTVEFIDDATPPGKIREVLGIKDEVSADTAAGADWGTRKLSSPTRK